MLAMPAILALVFALHFRSLAEFLHLRARYEPVAPDVVVPRLIGLANRWPLFHDPHVLAYLALPLLPLWALGLYALGRQHRPRLARAGVALSITGCIYLGGLFGMWTAFRRGFGDVDARYTDGAVAAYAALTAPHGAFLLTTTLAKVFMVGLLLQVAALWGRPGQARWSVLAVAAGSVLFLAFWDVDNVMFLATLLMFAGFVDIRRVLLDLPAPQPESADAAGAAARDA